MKTYHIDILNKCLFENGQMFDLVHFGDKNSNKIIADTIQEVPEKVLKEFDIPTDIKYSLEVYEPDYTDMSEKTYLELYWSTNNKMEPDPKGTYGVSIEFSIYAVDTTQVSNDELGQICKYAED